MIISDGVTVTASIDDCSVAIESVIVEILAPLVSNVIVIGESTVFKLSFLLTPPETTIKYASGSAVVNSGNPSIRLLGIIFLHGI